MSMLPFFVAVSVGAAVLVSAALAVNARLGTGSAALRHWIWTLTAGALVVLPVLLALQGFASPSPDPGTWVSAEGQILSLASPGRPSLWDWMLLFLWIGPTLVLLSRTLRGHLQARELIRLHLGPCGPEWASDAAWAADRLGLDRLPGIWLSEAVNAPVAAGLDRPAVLIPAWMRHESIPTRRRAILLHELAHVQRRDVWSRLASQLARALHWYNPLCWLPHHAIRVESERACDDRVLELGIRPVVYARTLLSVADALRGRIPNALAALGPSGSTLFERLDAVCAPGRNRRAVAPSARWIATAVATVAVMGVATTATPSRVSAVVAPAEAGAVFTSESGESVFIFEGVPARPEPTPRSLPPSSIAPAPESPSGT